MAVEEGTVDIKEAEAVVVVVVVLEKDIRGQNSIQTNTVLVAKSKDMT